MSSEALARIQKHLVTKSEAVISFKKKHLSALAKENQMAKKIGMSQHFGDLRELILQEGSNAAFRPKSAGFWKMNEIILRADLDGELSERYETPAMKNIVVAANNVVAEMKNAVAEMLGAETVAFRTYVDIINDESCIIPHSDGFLQHRLGFRVHVPLFTSSRSCGVTFHPYNTIARFWQMKEEGSIVIFNNFEPHTVTKLADERLTRAHLICDIGLKHCFDGLNSDEANAAKSLILSHGVGTTLHYSPNHITHTISNLDFRNRLGMHYGGMHPNSALEEQVEDHYVLKTRDWIKRLFEHAESQKLIEQIS